MVSTILDHVSETVSETQVSHDDDDKTATSTPDARKEEYAKTADPSALLPVPRRILPIIVLAQFCGTSLWFATNSITGALGLRDDQIGYSTSAVQFGFILGTLIVATTRIADLLSPSLLFCVSCVLGAICNAILAFLPSFVPLMLLRILTGMTLAGIYPIGMKIASDWFGPQQIGRALGWLVGALVLGTAFPFLLRQIPQPFQLLLFETSALAALGGITMYWTVSDGPHRSPPVPGGQHQGTAGGIVRLFREYPRFRGAAVGYFSHMWELYAFYTYCPVVWQAYIDEHDLALDAGLITFYIIAMGSVGCVVGGYISLRYGNAVVAYGSLAISGLMCLLSPLCFYLPPYAMLIFYLVWGSAVVADSPQFSSLVAKSAPAECKGTALTIVNCLGFSLTVVSIQFLGGIPLHPRFLFLLLAPGPIFGLLDRYRLVRAERARETICSPTKAKEVEQAIRETVVIQNIVNEWAV